MAEASVAVIGGSGFYAFEGLADVEEVRPATPFGEPSDAIVIGSLAGRRVAFLARHGTGHRLLPSEVPARANIFALKSLGVERIIAVSAVGSLRAELEPGHFAVPDQLIDRTQGRPATFFGGGLVAHIAFADPFCPHLREVLLEATRSAQATAHGAVTYLAVEGPAFSTRAESHLYRSLGAGVVGMTALPEAKLAREAEICYAVFACVTDYDSWHQAHEPVTAEMVLANLARSVDGAKKVLALALARLPAQRDCRCASALTDALVTARGRISESTLARLRPIIGKYAT